MAEFNKEIVKEAIKELYQEGCFKHTCPWENFPEERINAIKDVEPLPEGAVKMVLATWNLLSNCGKRIGNAIAVGLFMLICGLLVAGFFGVGKVGSWIISIFTK